MNQFFDLQHEQSVIGMMLNKQLLASEAIERLAPSDFVDPVCRNLFISACEVDEKGLDVDVTSLWLHHKDSGRSAGTSLALVGEISFNVVPTAGNMNESISKLKDYTNRRKLQESGLMMLDRAGDLSVPSSELVDVVTEELSGIISDSCGTGSYDAETACKIMMEGIDRRRENKGELFGARTGLSVLDSQISGWCPSDLVIVGGRPGMGKTALFINSMFQGGIKFGVPMAIAELEMTREQLFQRGVCCMSGLNTRAMRNSLSDENYYLVKEWAEHISKAPIYVEDRLRTIEDICSWARMLKRKHDIKVLGVDYIGLCSTKRNIKSREETISYISQKAKSLAKELEITVVLLAQLNRKVEERTDKKPMLSDLRDSGSLEQDADTVIFLYNQEYYNMQKGKVPEPSTTEIIFSKNRHGPTGTMGIKWIPQSTTFTDF